MSDDRKPAQNRKETPRWRIVLRFMIPVFLLIALVVGVMVGYVVIGKRSLSEVFLWDTWKHVYDLVFAP